MSNVGLPEENEDWSDDPVVKIPDNVLKRMFKDYKETLNTQSNKDEMMAKCMQDHSYQHSLICLICLSSVKHDHQIWTCSFCFDTFHLSCIQQWIQEGVIYKGGLSDELFPQRQIPWNCPKCRHAFERKYIPQKYKCFCGQLENPPSDPWLPAHSCGQKCGRLLRLGCGHRCMLLCHPGPCPPCPKMVMTSCFCGGSKNVAKRCGQEMWSCGKLCGNTLSCGKHSCKVICHEGACPPCQKSSLKFCVCGLRKEMKLCATTEWQCDTECGKSLPCGYHSCSKRCHKGECGKCPKSGSRTCPCGKSKADNLQCYEDVPTCSETCDKKLGCHHGHKCMRRCHHGECGQCMDVVTKTCRCGKKVKQYSCSNEFTCNIKCQKLRDCGIHQCKRMCCDGNCPSCERICGKTLQCKRHKCQLMCHQGRCFPCNLQSSLSCNCGSTTVLVMCGKEKSTKPPRCNKICTTPASCHHPKRQPHNCHFGRCPECTQVCGLVLECMHKCLQKCHDEVVVKSAIKAAGPWELTGKPSFTIAKLPCPPCHAAVTVKCYGGHDTSTMPCCDAKSYCCGRPCGNLLNCGLHNCEMPCHVTDHSEHPDQTIIPCMDCERPCSKPRLEGCTHACLSACHKGPCKRCKRVLRIQCHCKMTELRLLCCDFTGADADSKTRLMSCGNECQQKLPCGHPCGKLCHAGLCMQSCNKKVILKCPCKRKKKEFSCPDVVSGSQVLCDDICEAKLLHKQAEINKQQQKKLQEEHRIADKELERFERSLAKSSKSRRKRVTKIDDSNSENGGWILAVKKWRSFIVGTVMIAFFVTCFWRFDFI